MKAITVSHKGKRDSNQDLILEFTAVDGSYLFAVIDGMGGYKYGDLAAQLIAENIETYMSTVNSIDSYHLQKAINKANLVIRQKNSALSGNMGATIGGIVIKGNEVTYFWVGDVKIFHFRNQNLIYESTPHSLVNHLAESGSITDPSQLFKYRHVVTRSIQGDKKATQIEIKSSDFNLDLDMLLVCSDGVHDVFDAVQIEGILRSTNSTYDFLEELSVILLNEASDNFSIGLINNLTNR